LAYSELGIEPETIRLQAWSHSQLLSCNIGKRQLRLPRREMSQNKYFKYLLIVLLRKKKSNLNFFLSHMFISFLFTFLLECSKMSTINSKNYASNPSKINLFKAFAAENVYRLKCTEFKMIANSFNK